VPPPAFFSSSPSKGAAVKWPDPEKQRRRERIENALMIAVAVFYISATIILLWVAQK
jgi:Ca2+/Na+ antiporter